MALQKCSTLAFYALIILVSYHVSMELILLRNLRLNVHGSDKAEATQFASDLDEQTHSLITNEYYDTNCSAISLQNSSATIGNNILFCRKEYSNIISAFGMYCNDLSLYWFHRLISSQTLLSVTVPKHIFVYIHNMANATMCNGYNAQKRLYYSFVDYITAYFNGKLTIHLYFGDELHGDAYWRNFLVQKIHQLTVNGSLQTEYDENAVIQLFDADDLVHPQKLQLLDMLYTNMQINGTILHSFRYKICRSYVEQQEEATYNLYFSAMNTTSMASDYSNIHEFHLMQSKQLLSIFQFEYFDVALLQSQFIDSMIKVNKEIIAKQKLTHFYFVHGLWKLEYNMTGEIYMANGWPTTLLSALLLNPYSTAFERGHDCRFNIDTIDSDYDFYLLPYELGIYCQGVFKHRVQVYGD